MDRSRRGCDVEGCDMPHRMHGLCNTHYKRLYTCSGLKPEDPIVHSVGSGRPKLQGICVKTGCENEAVARNLCPKHYKQRRTAEKRRSEVERNAKEDSRHG